MPWSLARHGGDSRRCRGASGTLTFDDDDQCATVSVDVVADDTHEPLAEESFRLVSGSASATAVRSWRPTPP